MYQSKQKSISEMLDFFQQNPPSCLNDFLATPTESKDLLFDGHGEELNSFFSIRCKECSGDSFHVHGFNWTNPDSGETFFIGPVEVVCGSCKSTHILFDISKHGYDAELEHGCCSATNEGEAAEVQCTCGSISNHLVARFEYTDDLFDDDFSEAKGHESDFFSWFSLFGKCENCGIQEEILDYECA
jgi:hypothetical protein